MESLPEQLSFLIIGKFENFKTPQKKVGWNFLFAPGPGPVSGVSF